MILALLLACSAPVTSDAGWFCDDDGHPRIWWPAESAHVAWVDGDAPYVTASIDDSGLVRASREDCDGFALVNFRPVPEARP